MVRSNGREGRPQSFAAKGNWPVRAPNSFPTLVGAWLISGQYVSWQLGRLIAEIG